MKAKITIKQYMYLCREMSDNLGLQTSRFLENLDIVFNETTHPDIARVPNLFSAELDIILFIGKKTKNLAKTSVDFASLNKHFAGNPQFAPSLFNLQELSLISVHGLQHKTVHLNYTYLPIPSNLVANPEVSRENDEVKIDKKRKAKDSASPINVKSAAIQAPEIVSNINLCDTRREICSNAYIIAALRENVSLLENKTDLAEDELKKANDKIIDQAREIQRLKGQIDALSPLQNNFYSPSIISQVTVFNSTSSSMTSSTSRFPQITSSPLSPPQAQPSIQDRTTTILPPLPAPSKLRASKK